MSDSLRDRLFKIEVNFDSLCINDRVKLIESEINQARLVEAERAPHGNDCLSFNHDRSATGLDCSCARGKRIAQLSSVQQEAPKSGCGHQLTESEFEYYENRRHLDRLCKRCVMEERAR